MMERVYNGRKNEDLTYHGESFSVPDWAVRREVILYDGSRGLDQEGIGWSGFLLELKKRGMGVDFISLNGHGKLARFNCEMYSAGERERVDYASYVEKLSSERACHIPARFFVSIVDAFS